MSVIAWTTALGASACWAAGAILATGPSRRLGSFSLTRLQLVTSAPVLAVLVTVQDVWKTIDLQHWPAILISGTFGVLFGNLAMMACLRRGGPRRMQMMMAMSPIAVLAMSNLYLHEAITDKELTGCAITIAGIVMAIFFSARPKDGDHFESLNGSLVMVILFGLLAALCHGVGLIVLKPVMTAGTDPLATSFLRTATATGAILVASVIPHPAIKSEDTLDWRLFWAAVFPGFLGYVAAVSLLLIGLSIQNAGVVTVLGSLAPVLMMPMLWLSGTRHLPLSAWGGAALAVAGSTLLIAV
ncbi:DMT family transporter [Roseibium sp.]|uniref:DMT family transporter n=1 Tax=Roseibium sp. TaxID=1936156 RepID=UPI003A97D6CE